MIEQHIRALIEDYEAEADRLAEDLDAGYTVERYRALATGIYLGALRHLEPETFRAAVTRCVLECRHFPRPAEILALTGETPEDEALAAWSVVLHAARTVGRYESIDFGPVVNAAIRAMGSWIRLCEGAEEELHFRQRDFATVHGHHRRAGVSEDQGSHLAGLTELDHMRLAGRYDHEPRRISVGLRTAPQLGAGLN